jgi:hypothetical protein
MIHPQPAVAAIVPSTTPPARPRRGLNIRIFYHDRTWRRTYPGLGRSGPAYETKTVAGFYPAGCVSSTRSGVEVHLQFDDCTGPFGLVRLNGGIDATFSLKEGKLHAELVDSGDLTVQDNPVDYAASSDIRIDEGGYALTWTASWGGETAGGEAFHHTSDLDITSDPETGCATLSGDSSGSVGERGMDSVIEGYAVCPLECPSAGKITSTGKSSGRTVVVEFDGSATAQVTLPSGDVHEAPLVCSAAE